MEIGIAVFVIVWLYFTVKARNRKKEHDATIAELTKKLSASEYAMVSVQTDSNNKLKQFEAKYLELAIEYERLINKYNSLIENIESSKSLTELKKEVLDEGSKSIESNSKILPVLYFPVPNRNSTFPNAGSTAFNASQHMYQFTIVNEQGTKARFSFINHELTTKDALNDPQVYLRPVCSYENSISSETKQITTIEEGWAEKNGNVWTVTQKAMIHFEY
jgi:hypothetical protein